MKLRFDIFLIIICLIVLLISYCKQNVYATGLKESLGSWFTDDSGKKPNTEKIKTGKNQTQTEKKTLELKYLFTDTCQPSVFSDIKTSLFANDIQQLANLCIVRGTINPGKFYPDNFVRRADAISMFVHAYKSIILDKNDSIERRNFSDIKKGTKLDMLIQAAEKMGIANLFVTKKATKFNPDAFVTQADVRRIMVYLNTQYPGINSDSISILTNDEEYITRGELAHVIAVSLRPGNTTIVKKSNDEKTYPSIQTLIDIGILHPNSYIATHPKDPITRLEFLGLLVKCEQYRNPAIPHTSPSTIQYFADLIPTMEQIFTKEITSGSYLSNTNNRFDDFINMVNQAKNLGLTSFFETTKRGKLYLEPTKYVTEYEATVVINQTAPNKLPIDENSDAVLISNEKLASLLIISYNLMPTTKKTIKIQQKATLGELRNRIKNMFISGKSI